MMPRRGQIIEFKRVDGREIPMQPWPQVFFISGQWLADYDGYNVRPLTATSLLRDVSRNFITMNYWRLMIQLRILGFLTTKELERLSWRHFTLRFWEHQMWWRFRIVKHATKIWRRYR